ncbi:MAG: malto-oligosyltrehalose trehalohydrolase, partial [Verrucomicrobiaceae bacterium]
MTPWFPPQGAELTAHGVRYFVWAPDHTAVDVEVYTEGGALARTVTLTREKNGYFRGTDPLGRAGDRYKVRADNGHPWPAPGSHSQPDGVHGASEVTDSTAYHWNDATWQRPPFRDLAIYELHIGTFTPEGTFSAAIGKLPYLRELGVTAIEIMPVADFPGDRGWGYDGVQLYAPARCYGSPDDLRALVDAAHQAGIAVILDVVYNHFGPDGNYLTQFSRFYFESEDNTPWGRAINFGRENNHA